MPKFRSGQNFNQTHFNLLVHGLGKQKISDTTVALNTEQNLVVNDKLDTASAKELNNIAGKIQLGTGDLPGDCPNPADASCLVCVRHWDFINLVWTHTCAKAAVAPKT